MSALETKRTTMPAKNSFRDSTTVIEQEFHWQGNVPHWVRPGDVLSGSYANLRVTGNRAAKWIEMTAEEGYEVPRIREGKPVPDEMKLVSKKTMLALDRAQAEALRDFLNAVLGGSSREARVL
jgi:hypothetical protein